VAQSQWLKLLAAISEDNCMGDPMMCSSCISPAYFHGNRESGDGPFTVTVGAVTDGVMRLTLEAQTDVAGTKFRGFLLKVPSGSLEMVSDASQYKDCTGQNGANGNSPGGTGLRQAAIQTDVDAKTKVELDWVLPSTQGSTMDIEVTAIFMFTSDEWFGFVKPIAVTHGSPGDGGLGGSAPEPQGLGGSGYAEITLGLEMPALGAETESFKAAFISELAVVLSVAEDRLAVHELTAGSVVVGVIILPGGSAADKNAKELLAALQVECATGGAVIQAPLIVFCTCMDKHD
jgi:hypothetical protein